MSYSIDQSFVEQFEADVHMVYQRKGSKLRNTVRTKNNVKNKTTFQKVGKGQMATKTRHGLVPVMNLDHTPVPVTLSDYYAGEWVDDLDELRIEHSERMVVVETAAAAAGRKTDDIILTEGTTNGTTFNGGTAIDFSAAGGLGQMLAAREALDNNDVPDDGNRFWWIPPKGWSQFMQIDQFANADYVGADQMVFSAGQSAKFHDTFFVSQHSGLPDGGANEKKSLLYHSSAIGHAIGTDIRATWSWENTRSAFFLNLRIQMEAVVIHAEGAHIPIFDVS